MKSIWQNFVSDHKDYFDISGRGGRMNLERFIEEAKAIGLLGIMISRCGEEIAHVNLDYECRRNVYSATKSYTALAVGFAVQEGLLRLDEKLINVFPEDLPDVVSDNLAKAVVRDLLTMCLGQGKADLMGDQRPLIKEDNWVKYSLALPFDYEPGTKFVYNNVGPHLAAILVQQRAGCDLASYLYPRFFKPLGIRKPTWEIDPLGYHFGAGGLFLSMSELHKLGLFCLQKGKWNGRQLLNAAWIEECTKPQDSEQYGYLFWIGKDGSYRADGKYCQLSMVLPEKDSVITTVAECRDSRRLMALIENEIVLQL